MWGHAAGIERVGGQDVVDPVPSRVQDLGHRSPSSPPPVVVRNDRGAYDGVLPSSSWGAEARTSTKDATVDLNEALALEEYDENQQATGVELEQIDDSNEFEDIEEPWDPEKIRVNTSAFSMRHVLDMIEEASLELAPDFQRLEVWRAKQKARLIESLLLQIPLPAFYFAEDANGKLKVVDGLQRLSTVLSFVRGGDDGQGGFELKDLEYIHEVQGLRYDDLPLPWKRRINNTQIQAHVIAPETPSPVMYDIFKRINTGGTPLNAQEIRHCMSGSRSRQFLLDCISADAFVSATNNVFSRQKRMVDREVVLRFVAFKLLKNIDEYAEVGPMENLLWNTTERLDDPTDITDIDLGNLQRELIHGLRLAEDIFGVHAFRKWRLDETRRSPFNRALFETWTYGLSKCAESAVEESADLVADLARSRMTEDLDYMSSITVSTGDPRRVTKRFSVVQEILNEALE